MKLCSHLNDPKVFDWSWTNMGAYGGNTRHDDWPQLAIRDLRDFESFSGPTFEYGYPHVWNNDHKWSSVRKPPRSMRNFTGEDSIERYITAVYQTTLGQVFEQVNGKGKDNLDREIWTASGSLINLGSDISRSNKPDWIIGVAGPTLRDVPYGIGDTKSGNKWDPRQLLAGENYNARNEYENMLPIRQLAHYCLLASTCYGFILTEREVTVLRFTAEHKPAVQSYRQALPRAAAPSAPNSPDH